MLGRFWTMVLSFQNDLKAAVYEPSILGVEGMVVWGSHQNSKNAKNCSAVAQYLKATYGPYVENVLNMSEKCSQQLCNSHGRCMLNTTALELFNSGSRQHKNTAKYSRNLGQSRGQSSSKQLKYSPNDTTNHSAFMLQLAKSINSSHHVMKENSLSGEVDLICQCYASWMGDHCQKSKVG